MKFLKQPLTVMLLAGSLLLGACGSQDEPMPEENQEMSEVAEPAEKAAKENEPNSEASSLSINLEEAVFDPESVAVLVNKEYGIGEYEPDDLVAVEVPTVLENPEVWQMREEAADALESMFAAAKEAGILLHARSGYRSYDTQVQLFNNYAEAYGEEEANKFSSRPGHSEHQTGLSMDVTSESVNFQLTEEFGETAEGQWVAENAHRFGFIIRYPEGKSDVTGYIYEPWHIRYLGDELASAVFENSLTYEEFLADQGVVEPKG